MDKKVVMLTIQRPLYATERSIASPWNPEEKIKPPTCFSCFEKFPNRLSFTMIKDFYYCSDCMGNWSEKERLKNG